MAQIVQPTINDKENKMHQRRIIVDNWAPHKMYQNGCRHRKGDSTLRPSNRGIIHTTFVSSLHWILKRNNSYFGYQSIFTMVSYHPRLDNFGTHDDDAMIGITIRIIAIGCLRKVGVRTESVRSDLFANCIPFLLKASHFHHSSQLWNITEALASQWLAKTALQLQGKPCLVFSLIMLVLSHLMFLSDLRYGIQAQTVSMNFPKIYKISEKCMVGFTGLASDCQTV